MLYDVLIYNFEKGFENAQIIKSDSGRLEMTADKTASFIFTFQSVSSLKILKVAEHESEK